MLDADSITPKTNIGKVAPLGNSPNNQRTTGFFVKKTSKSSGYDGTFYLIFVELNKAICTESRRCESRLDGRNFDLDDAVVSVPYIRTNAVKNSLITQPSVSLLRFTTTIAGTKHSLWSTLRAHLLLLCESGNGFCRSIMANFLAQFQSIKNSCDHLVISGIFSLPHFLFLFNLIFHSDLSSSCEFG